MYMYCTYLLANVVGECFALGFEQTNQCSVHITDSFTLNLPTRLEPLVINAITQSYS